MSLFNFIRKPEVLHFVADNEQKLDAAMNCCTKSKHIRKISIIKGNSSEYHILVRCDKRWKTWITWYIECSMGLC